MRSQIANPDGYPVTLLNCDEEPIHIPGCVQPHGIIFALEEPEFRIQQVSDNIGKLLGLELAEVLEQPLRDILTEEVMGYFEQAIALSMPEGMPRYVCTSSPVRPDGTQMNLMVHRFNGVLILEMEPAVSQSLMASGNGYTFFQDSLNQFKSYTTLEGLYESAAREVKRVIGFDRVMIYQFDPDGHGTVVAEAKEPELESFLGLHYPSTDIPKQARELYLKNWLRFIPHISYDAARLVPTLNPKTNQPLDMSFCNLRSVSPIHVEYLQNMGVSATMTISLIQNGKLWGLVACHHYSKLYVNHEIRTMCEMLGHFISLSIGVTEATIESAYRLRLKTMQNDLLGRMFQEPSLIDALIDFQPNLGDFIHAEGAALMLNGEYKCLGKTPPEKDVRELVKWLRKNMVDDCLMTHRLSDLYPAALGFRDSGAGLMAISISAKPGSYALWFRPEIYQTVDWAGDPTKDPDFANSREGKDTNYLSPRRSFKLWKEEVFSASLPWMPFEQQAANEIRNAILRVQLQKAEDLSRQNAELEKRVIERTNQLTATNKELEAFSYSVSHDLRAPLRSLDGYSQALIEEASGRLSERETTYLQYIRESSQKMGILIEDLINLSLITRNAMRVQTVNLPEIVDDLIASLRRANPERDVTFVKSLKTADVEGDPVLLRVMLQNLIENAWKFTGKIENARIEMGEREIDGRLCYFISDNGAGFKNRYAHKIFGAFQRLHRDDEFSGTGIGLATVQRIIHRHGGSVWAESEIGVGTTIYFSFVPNSETSLLEEG